MYSNREWMYKMRSTRGGLFNPAFIPLVNHFLDFAFANAPNNQSQTVDGVEVLVIRCPCINCKNRRFKTREEVEGHLYDKGFMDDYEVWYVHGESWNTQVEGQSSKQVLSQDVGQEIDDDFGMYTEYDEMVVESMHHQQGAHDSNKTVDAFYTMLKQSNKPLWDGCKNATTLSITTMLLNWKSDYNISDSSFDKLLQIIKDILPDDNKLPSSFYDTKKILKPLELPSERIHVCVNHCMLFYGEYADMDHCVVCDEKRYKERGNKVPRLVMTYMPIGPRLQRLFYSTKTAQHLTWHANHVREPGKMSHPSEGEAWQHFDSVYPDFAQETRNIRLGLCTDGFSPNNSNVTPYSCWPVFITVYNLPPWLALKERYMQVPLIIPGPKNPGQNLDVFLQPLINELKSLFAHGIETYDAYRKNNFRMRAVLLWTISDFPAYAMLSGWSTHGKLACPYCSNESGSFQLSFGGKPCWFDCHRQYLSSKHCFRKDSINFTKNVKVSRKRQIPEPTGEEIWQTIQHFPIVYNGNPFGKDYEKPIGFGETHNWVKRSIFWELPYWRHLLIRHNLDVMHIEKNVFENLFYTMMGTNKKSKDNIKARQDLEILCDRSVLNPIRGNNGKMSIIMGNYTLKKNDVKKVCAWLKKLKFPDGYASNIGNCVNTKENSFHPFKSHDSHVFMQRLLPISIRGFVSNETYEVVTELCMFFRVLCSKTLHVNDLLRMGRTIVPTICKLEKIFPPGFFDSMEHLIIHLAREALLGGPVQYRWMYQYERRLGMIKRRIRNKSRVEGSIMREHLVNEIATYCSLYFDSTMETRHNREPRNFAPQHSSSSSGDSQLSVFVVPSKRLYEKGGKRRLMSIEELKKAHTYILLNCAEVARYVTEFDAIANQLYPHEPVLTLRDEHFAEWFEERVKTGLSDGSTKHLQILARKPSMFAQSHKGYFVNGYKFHTQHYGKGHVTNNYGVCVRGSAYNSKESDYYGLLDEILELEYYGNEQCSTVVVLKCTWFDNKRGVVVGKNKLVDVKPKSRLQNDDPFVLASQAEQVFYTSYPSINRDTKDLWAVVKTKSRHIYEVSAVETDDNTEEHGILQFEERFKLPEEVTRSERLCLVRNTHTDNDMMIGEDGGRFEDDQYVEEEFDDEEYLSDDYDDEMVFSDHFFLVAFLSFFPKFTFLRGLARFGIQKEIL